MKYESTILKRLIDTYGVVGNPRYISEIIKEFIVRGKERFPELFTYQADWLEHIDEFGLNPSYTVSYTGQSIYAPNTLERPVKSAILKGQTLVNIVQNQFPVTTWWDNTGKNSFFKDSETPKRFKPDTDYLFIFEGADTITVLTGVSAFFTANNIDISGKKLKLRTLSELTSKTFTPHFKSSVGGALSAEEKASIRFMILEYQEGMENWDIPYFEGMKSVQMPVLSTVGKNLLNPSWKKAYGKFYPFKLKKGTTLTLSTKDSIPSLGGNLLFTSISGREKWFAIDAGATKNTITLDEDIYQVNNILTGDIEYQLEIGSVATSYEPYQSNILTVNEDVTLRGIGDVKDTLDCLTGEVTERIGEIVLDGSEIWNYHENLSTDTLAVFSVYNDFGYLEWLGVGSILCDKFPITQKRATDSNAQEGIYDKDGWAGKNKIPLIINKDRLSSVSVDGLKLWLSNNQLKLQFKLQNKSIKRVALTIKDHNGQSVDHLNSFNGGTHVYTSSLDGSLVPSVDISVETDLEETLKMCSLDGNTM